MKKILALALAAVMLVSMVCVVAAEDESFTIQDITYNGELLCGKVIGEIPEGKRGGVEVTLFLSGNRYLKTTVPMIDGEFELSYSEPAEYITMVPVSFTRLTDAASRVRYTSGAAQYFVK